MPTTYNPAQISSGALNLLNLDPRSPIPTHRLDPLDQAFLMAVAFDGIGWAIQNLIKAHSFFTFSAVPARPAPPAEPEPHHGFRVMGSFGARSQFFEDSVNLYEFWDTYATAPPDVDPTGPGIIGVPLGLTPNQSIVNFCQVLTANTGYDVTPSKYFVDNGHGGSTYFDIHDGESQADFITRADTAGGFLVEAQILAKTGGPQWNFPIWDGAADNCFARPPWGGGYVFESARQPNLSYVHVNATQNVDWNWVLQSVAPEVGLVLDPTTALLVPSASDPKILTFCWKYYIWGNRYAVAIWAKLGEPLTDGFEYSSFFCTCLYTPDDYKIPPEPITPETSEFCFFSVVDFRNDLVYSGNMAVQAGLAWNRWFNDVPAGTIGAGFVVPNGGNDTNHVTGPLATALEVAPLVALNANRGGDTTAYIYGYLPGALIVEEPADLDNFTLFDGSPYICGATDGVRSLWLESGRFIR